MPPEDLGVSLKNYTISEVRQRIIDGRYALGQRLSENTLAKELDISRAPARDALMTLRAEGLVLVYPQRGSYVFNPSPEERLALCEVCAVYEMGALTLAMEHNPNKLCDVLGEQIRLGEAALERDGILEWAKSDRIFHESLIRLSANPFLEAAYQAIGSRIAALVHRLPSTRERIATSVAEHQAILSMICRRDTVRAMELLRANNIAVAAMLGASDELCSR